jgi:MFS family permease
VVGERTYPHYRRNFIALVADFAGFGLGFAFYSPSTVLPAFVSELTSSAPLIGLISTLLTGAWLLPQLFAANFLAAQERQKPYLMLSAAIGRVTFFLLAGIVYLWADRRPGVTLIALYACIAVLMACDAVTSVAWIDMWPKMIPPARRGRMIGLGQVLSGLMTIGAAEVVRRVLSPAGPPFPANYALLFLLAGVAMMMSLGALASLREPRGVGEGRRRAPWREFLPRLSRMLREDSHFRLLNVVRLLGGLSGLAGPFYIVYATGELGMTTDTIGLFITAQTVGSVVAGLALGYLNERWGGKIVVQVSRLLALVQPLLALGLAGASGALGGAMPLVYALIFLLMGIINNAMMPGFFSYLVYLAPEDERPVYVGLSNTLSGVLMVVPLAGGWLLEATSYPVLFAATAAGSTLSLLFALQLAEVRQHALARAR